MPITPIVRTLPGLPLAHKFHQLGPQRRRQEVPLSTLRGVVCLSLPDILCLTLPDIFPNNQLCVQCVPPPSLDGPARVIADHQISFPLTRVLASPAFHGLRTPVVCMRSRTQIPPQGPLSLENASGGPFAYVLLFAYSFAQRNKSLLASRLKPALRGDRSGPTSRY